MNEQLPQPNHPDLTPQFLAVEQSMAMDPEEAATDQVPQDIANPNHMGKQFVTVTEKEYKNGAKHYYGVDARGRKHHLGIDAILENYDHAGEYGKNQQINTNIHTEPEAEHTPRHAGQEVPVVENFMERAHTLAALPAAEQSKATQGLIDDLTHYANSRGLDAISKAKLFMDVLDVYTGESHSTSTGKHSKQTENGAEPQEYVGKHRKVVETSETPLFDEVVREQHQNRHDKNSKVYPAGGDTPIYDELKQELAKAEGSEESQQPQIVVAGKPLTRGELDQYARDFAAIAARGKRTSSTEAPAASGTEEEIPDLTDEDIPDLTDEDIPDLSDEPEAMAQRRKNIFARLRNRMVGTAVGAHGRRAERGEDESHRKRNAAIAAGVIAVGALVAWKLGAFSGGGSHHSEAHQALNGTLNSTNPHDAIAASGHIDFSHVSGQYPWDVLHNAGIPTDQIENKLTDAAKAAHLPYQWHGTGDHRWIEVAGKSDTKSVMDALGKYITK